MYHFIRFPELNSTQVAIYKKAIRDGFPDILSESEGMTEFWRKIDACFPDTQIFMIDGSGSLLGFMNTIPVSWNRTLEELPDEGWDWLAQKGILDYKNGIVPNSLGGLQIIVTKANLGKGYSKLLIGEAKRMVSDMGFEHFFIPIRPTFKHKYPDVPMEEYMNRRADGKIYDPWIRTHINSGARILKICPKAMTIQGDIDFWEKRIGKKITQSGSYIVPGALNPVTINVELNKGVYEEPNIWIAYQ